MSEKLPPNEPVDIKIMRWVSFTVVTVLLTLAGIRTIENQAPFDKTLGFIILSITGASLGAFSFKYIIDKFK